MALSPTALAEIFEDGDGLAWIALIEITHADITTLRFALENEDVVSGGDTYTASAMEVVLPPDTDSRKPGASLRIQNVDRVLSDSLRGLTGLKPQLTLSVVLHTTPNTVEYSISLEVDSARWDAGWCDLQVTLGNLFDRAWPRPKMTGDNFPGLFPNA